MIIDTHAHYNLEPLLSDWKTHWQKAQDFSVLQSIVVGTTVEESQKALEIAKGEQGLYASFGIHPSNFSVSNGLSLDDLDATYLHLQLSCKRELEAAGESEKDFLQSPAYSSKLIAIGEIGLDYYRLSADDQESRKRQKQYFSLQLQLAFFYSLPVIIHVRDITDEAYRDIYEIISKELPVDYPVLLHCISGPQEYLKKMLERGAYIGVGGNITYKNSQNMRDLVKNTPADKILLETDAPYLPPFPHRGKPCEPWMISLTADFMAQEFHITREQVISNTYRFFAHLPRIDYNTAT
ncbi:MAG: TatD family hydrolase [Microgenomates group bacterium]